MPVSPLLGSVRIIGGLGLVIAVALFGFYGRSVWVLPVLALIFTVSFGLGRWRAWSHAKRSGTIPTALIAQLGTYVVQLIVCAVFFLIGRGLASLSGGVESMAFGSQDWTWLAVFASYAIAVGVLVLMLERQPPDAQTFNVLANAHGLKIDPTPISEQTFWKGHHYANKDNVYNDEVETTLNEDRAFVSEDQIKAEETRLGISLPPVLRRLYAVQNGGGALRLYVPCDDGRHNSEEGWINPFSGYDILGPLTEINTLKHAIEAYADPVDEPDRFPLGADKMIVLAQWYSETLYLDYRQSAAPSVGFIDFDRDAPLNTSDWEADALVWPDFDTFFAELRREAN